MPKHTIGKWTVMTTESTSVFGISEGMPTDKMGIGKWTAIGRADLEGSELRINLDYLPCNGRFNVRPTEGFPKIEKDSLKDVITLLDVLCPSEDEKTSPVRIGIGFVNRDKSINVVLDCWPRSGRLILRTRIHPKKKEVS